MFTLLQALVMWVQSCRPHLLNEIRPACERLPIFMDRFPLVKWYPKRYMSWAWEVAEEDDERNTGHLGKEKKMLYKFSWQERVSSFLNRRPSSIFLFRFHCEKG